VVVSARGAEERVVPINAGSVQVQPEHHLRLRLTCEPSTRLTWHGAGRWSLDIHLTCCLYERLSTLYPSCQMPEPLVAASPLLEAVRCGMAVTHRSSAVRPVLADDVIRFPLVRLLRRRENRAAGMPA
jgi:hypothetical protein